jgi:integrative and conjugative element protein (TIGR02256 family)
MPLPDDLVSWHGATFSMRLRRRVDDPSSGWLTLSYADDRDGHGIHSQSVPIPPVTTLRPSGDREWQIRLHSQAAASLHTNLKRESPNETGGILIGLIHPGRRIIYITRIIGAPQDSEGTVTRFKRGVLHLPEEIDYIQNASGGLLGYVGEWHTHPLGGRQPSATDRATMAEIRRHLEPAGLPTLLLIVTPRHIDAHISVPNHLL